MLYDLRLAIRSLLRRPGSTALAILALALGIGANAAIFSFVEGIVLRPLPYPDPDRVVDLSQSTGLRTNGVGAVAPRDLDDFKKLDKVFAYLAGYERDGKNVSFAGSPERLSGLRVEPSYFDVLGVRPAVGRAFAANENTAGNDGIVIVSSAVHERRFSGATDILDKSILMDGRPYRIVGVMPKSFRTPEDLQAISQIDYIVPDVIPDDMRTNRGEHILSVVGRLQPGVSVEDGNRALKDLSARIAADNAGTNKDVSAVIRSGQEVIAGGLKEPMLLLLGASALIFFIAAVNVASLLAARAVEEGRDVAVRVALGASRLRVVRESVTRSVVLAMIGCVLGLAVAVWLKGALIAAAPDRTPRLQDIHIDVTVVAIASALSILGAALFGVIPALSVYRARALEALRAAGRSGASREGRRGRNALVAIEIGLAVLPLVGATLLVRSLASLRGVDLGFETEHVLAVNLPLPDARYATPDARFQFFENVTEKARGIAGVEAVGFANRFPLRGGWSSGIQLDGESGDTYHDVDFQAVGGDYFKALGLTLLRGRSIDHTDTKEGPPVVVVNEAYVRKYLADKGEPVGHRMRRGEGRPWITIVGVVSDLRRGGVMAAIEPGAYLAAAQTGLYPVRLADFAVRVRGNPGTIVKPLQAAVWSVDPEQPLANVRTLAETVDGTLAPRRFQTLLLTLFACLALALALIGVYGVVASTVARRTQEIGLRMALGARAQEIARMVVGESLLPATFGLVAGLAGAYFMARAMSGLVFGIAVIDPASFSAAPIALLSAVALASLLPALRASRIEPTNALRDE